MSDQMQRSACGAKVFLCSDYTDDPRYVDCKRCQRATSFKEYDPQRFDVDIWNHEGDVIRWFRSVTADELDGIRAEYADNPSVSLSVRDL